MIKIEHLEKRINNIPVLRDISTQVNTGDIVSFIGPSGSGKSTLLRCLNLLEKPDAGSIILDDEDITDSSCNKVNLRRKVGMVFQNYQLYQHLTVVENCMVAPVSIYKINRQQAYNHAMDILELFGLDDKALVYPEQLSGGQCQRVAIARVLAGDPEILLLDEPTSALDPVAIGELAAQIRKINENNITICVVTHSMEFAKSISNKIVFLDKGTVIEEGTPSELFNHPKKERTRKFVYRLACMDLVVTHDKHNLMEEIGKLYSFCSLRQADLEKISLLTKIHEEICSLALRGIMSREDTMYMTLEYSDADKCIRYNVGIDTENERNFDDEFLQESLEWMLISHYASEISKDQWDEETFTRFVFKI